MLAGNGRLLAGVSQRRRARFRPFSSLPKMALFLTSPNAKKGEKWDAKIRTFDFFARYLKLSEPILHKLSANHIERCPQLLAQKSFCQPTLFWRLAHTYFVFYRLFGVRLQSFIVPLITSQLGVYCICIKPHFHNIKNHLKKSTFETG
jgi:hypothetical protein